MVILSAIINKIKFLLTNKIYYVKLNCEVKDMINTKTLREKYKKERLEMSKSERIGSAVFLILGAVVVALVVRGICVLIVLIHHSIK